MNFNPLKTNTNPTNTNNQVVQRSNTPGYSYKNQLMPHMEITALCSEKHTEHVSKYTPWADRRNLNVKPGGTCSNHWSLNV
jgi:hypothetical protein